MNIQELLGEARESISEFCMTECNAYCCRKGYLVLTELELNLVVPDENQRFDLESNDFIKLQKDGLFSLSLSNSLGSCPSLDGSKCLIHKNPKRPKTCDSYPIFIDGAKKEIRLFPRCLAIRENKLYPYVHKFLKIGFKINKF